MNRSVITTLVVAAISAGCSGSGPAATPSSAATATTRPSPSAHANVFPIEAFADTSEDPVSGRRRRSSSAILDDTAGETGCRPR